MDQTEGRKTDRRAIERWARATFGRLMHPSMAAVKRMAQEVHPHGEGPA